MLLHLPLPEELPAAEEFLPLLPPGLRAFALYVQAHYLYLRGIQLTMRGTSRSDACGIWLGRSVKTIVLEGENTITCRNVGGYDAIGLWKPYRPVLTLTGDGSLEGRDYEMTIPVGSGGTLQNLFGDSQFAGFWYLGSAFATVAE